MTCRSPPDARRDFFAVDAVSPSHVVRVPASSTRRERRQLNSRPSLRAAGTAPSLAP